MRVASPIVLGIRTLLRTGLALARASHFMGSTRMSRSPRDGVVDERCRVHGVKNLYVAGGSVLPTGGATMVTFNLLALALRLADDLKREFVRR